MTSLLIGPSFTCATADFRFRLDFLPAGVATVVDGPDPRWPGAEGDSPSEQEEDDELGMWSSPDWLGTAGSRLNLAGFLSMFVVSIMPHCSNI